MAPEYLAVVASEARPGLDPAARAESCPETRWTRLYLRDGGPLNAAPPPATASTDVVPVASASGPFDTRWLDFWGAAGHRAYDSRPVLAAPDGRIDGAGALRFVTAPLEAPLTIAGPITLNFTAALAGRDATFSARLSDVWPDGSTHALTSGQLRASLRALDETKTRRNAAGDVIEPWQPFAAADPPAPAGEADYTMEIWPTADTFGVGHRVEPTLALQHPPWHVPEPGAAAAVLRRDAAHPAFLVLPSQD